MENAKPSTRRSITFRMTITVCAFVILVLSLLATLALGYFQHELKRSISTQQNTLLTVISQEIDQKLLDAQRAIVTASLRITPQAVADPAEAQRLLGDLRSTEIYFDDGLFLLSKEGRIIAESSNDPVRRGRDLSFRDYFKRTVATGKPVISAPFLSALVPGVPLVVFTSPVLDRDGTLIAVLIGGVNLLQDNFLGELSHTRIAKNGYIYLFSGDRTMIMHPDRSRIMAKDVPPGVNKLLDRALTGYDGSEENVNSRGLYALTSVKHLKATDWILGANYPLAEAYEPIYRARKYCIAAILISAILTILVIRIIMNSYTDALVRFALHVKNISSKQGAERLFRIDSADEIGFLANTFNSMIKDHDASNEELRHISSHDALSGLYNRAYFDEELKRLSSGRISPVSVVMADIDDLKVCNDRYGHSAGDDLIKATARILLKCFRTEDAVARIGGDEFAVLLPGVDDEHAQIVMKRIRTLAVKYDSPEEAVQMSISLGCATVTDPSDLPEAIKHADQQMYLDKISRKVQIESEL